MHDDLDQNESRPMNSFAAPQTPLNHWLRLGIPCCLGALAGVFDYLTVQDKLTPAAYCVVNRTIPAGGTIAADALSRLDITGGSDFVSFAVPYSDVAGFIGSRASLRIDKNSVLLWQHLDRNQPIPVGTGEIKIGLNGVQLANVDVPDWITPGDRVVLHVEANNSKYKELGPLTVSSATYLEGEHGKSTLGELNVIVKKSSRYFGEIMKLKSGQELKLFNISRT
jgi:hypothetical protein